ncbi:hemolysin family protein [Azospirillum sp. SYSU D00513]|uniref:hemolysin family protein n=1 Tax=Azospirillum sp. SYSU D00513 TaxID=2812561 RepID=UPI001A97672E|nr:hemolysin family protein [Azospirillum sp. SYSU D00513]
MTEASDSRAPREDGAEDHHSLGRLFKGWVRSVVGGRGDTTLRHTIKELIADQPDEDDQAMGAAERALFSNILKVHDRTVADVMVPRADIVAVEIGTPMPALVKRLSEEAHSRLPVYRETLDDVAGLVHIKDVLACIANGRSCELKDLVREVSVVAPSMPVLDLLLQMRQTRQHMALVVDEFGGIDGLVTIEDLVEEIVGEIEDEHDLDAAPRLVARADGSLVADARVSVEEFEARVGPLLTEDEREEIDTLGGLAVSLAGRVPGRGETVTHPSGVEFAIIEADSRRIKRLLIRNLPAAARALAAAQ